MSSASLEPSESTIRRLAALQESDEEDEDEGTAKVHDKPNSRGLPETSTTEMRGSVSQNRLSSLFEGWMGTSSPASSNRSSAIFIPENRKSVSEPRLVEHHTGASLTTDRIPEANEDDESSDVDENDFKQMLVGDIWSMHAFTVIQILL